MLMFVVLVVGRVCGYRYKNIPGTHGPRDKCFMIYMFQCFLYPHPLQDTESPILIPESCKWVAIPNHEVGYLRQAVIVIRMTIPVTFIVVSIIHTTRLSRPMNNNALHTVLLVPAWGPYSVEGGLHPCPAISTDAML
jgi:hypothetical protein